VLLIALGMGFAHVSARAQNAAQLTDTTVELASGNVFYRDSGSKGIPVVFLHGGPGNSLLWEQQIPAFTAAGYRFIAIDYRGIDDRLRNGNAPEVVAQLASKLGLAKFHLLGTGSGGNVALQYALAHREQLRSVIISNSNGNVREKEFSEMTNRIRPATFNQLPIEVRDLGPSYRAINPNGVQRWLTLVNAAQTGNMINADGKGGKNSGQGHNGSGARLDTGSDNRTAATWANLDDLKVPILLMTGDADLYTPPALLRVLAARIKQAEVAIIPESGHSAFWENPDIFNRTVLAFISKY
jgi:pimeloyl-ACP methyl ester carboxylesterase